MHPPSTPTHLHAHPHSRVRGVPQVGELNYYIFAHIDKQTYKSIECIEVLWICASEGAHSTASGERRRVRGHVRHSFRAGRLASSPRDSPLCCSALLSYSSTPLPSLVLSFLGVPTLCFQPSDSESLTHSPELIIHCCCPPPSSRGVGLVNREPHPAAHGTPCTFFYSHRICFWRLVDSRDRSRSNKSLPLESGLLLSLFTNRLLRTFNSLTFSYLCQFSELRISILYVCISRPSLSSSSFFLRNPSFLFTNSKFILYFWFAKISIYGPFQINLRYHAVSCRQIHNLF